MKKYSLALLALLLVVGSCACAEMTIMPIREEPITLQLLGLCAVPRDDGSHIFAGTVPRQDGLPDAPSMGVMYHVDEQGTELWRLEWEAAFSVFFRDMVPLSDGSVAVLSNTEQSISGEGRRDNLLIVRDGVQLSDTTLTPANDAIWIRLFPAREGFFVFQGEGKERDRHGGTFHIAVLEKRGNDGSLQWRHVFDEHELQLTDVIEADGGYLFFGVAEEQHTGNRLNEGVAVRIAEDGALQWVAQVGDKSGGISFSGAALTGDGDVLLTGGYLPTKQPKIGLLSSPVTARLSLDGSIRWQRIYDDMGVETSSFGGLTAVENGYLTVWGEIDYLPPLHVVLIDGEGELLKQATLDTETARAALRVWIELEGGKPHLLFTERRLNEAGHSESVSMLHVMEIGL